MLIKSVQILINQDDLVTLKNKDYRLCLAKKVEEGNYDVVWYATDLFLESNEFNWTTTYELFASREFHVGEKCVPSFPPVKIKAGQTSVLLSSGVMEKPTNDGPANAITLRNHYSHAVHPGLSQESMGNGVRTTSPVYISRPSLIQGTISIVTEEKVLVWFQQDVETAAIFTHEPSSSVEIDLTESNTERRLYKEGKWSVAS